MNKLMPLLLELLVVNWY